MSRPPEDLPSLQALVLGEFQHLLGELAPEGAELPALSPTVPDRQEHGDLSIPCHPLARVFRKAPQAIAGDLAAALESSPTLARAEAVNGFLNLHFDPARWFAAALGPVLAAPDRYGHSADPGGQRVMVEFSSPNTNKPLHLGHVRNNLLGNTVCNLLAAQGHDVVRANLVNDRGIHICKSMLAYQRFGEGETPESTGIKGDMFVGGYYVRFDKEQSGDEGEVLLEGARDLLRRWEAGDEEVVALWKRMNSWVYDGFDRTYERLGIRFDRIYHESQTYQLGRATVLEALDRGIGERGDDDSVAIDLTDDGLDRKLLLRSDGTSLYITQDIGTAQLKQDDYGLDRSIYVVGSEQDYHFKVLFLILGKMGFEWAAGLQHLSYGMVYLPEGKMKSREGKVVDADDLMEDVVASVRERMLARDVELRGDDGEDPRECASAVAEHSEQALGEMAAISETVGLGALKFYMLKFGARKDFTFKPDESISLQGDTGPYVQFAYTRIVGILRKAGIDHETLDGAPLAAADLASLGNPEERALCQLLGRFPTEVALAADSLNPAAVCAFLLQVAQAFHRFVHDHKVLRASDDGQVAARACLCMATAVVLRQGLALLGIEAPARM
ncbi:MAG: arginine--tRNA ligase [Myxococcota bacterium]|jgi:arginyl-tRNA synthetase|nr:arginine--tRNA ligase [Myxococcota bacterium]